VFGELDRRVKQGRKAMGKPLFLLIALCLAIAGCGSEDEALVTVAISAPVEMPFHGPSGPGTEPMYIGFTWTVVVSAAGGPDSYVGMVRTQVTEKTSGTVLTGEDGPLGTLSGGGRLEVKQGASGFFSSSLYPGDWTAVTTVEVTHAGGRSETVSTSFGFR
jgi:hypothetical protein